MKLRNKFFLGFLIVALTPLFISAIVSFRDSEKRIETRVLNQLDSLADVQKKRVLQSISKYLDQIRSVASNSLIIESLIDYLQNKDNSSLDKIHDLIVEEADLTLEIEDIVIRDELGNLIVSTAPNAFFIKSVLNKSQYEAAINKFLVNQIVKTDNNRLVMQVFGPLIFENDLIGIIEVYSSIRPIVEITGDYTGLGKTGEVVLAKKNNNGDAVYITPLRFDSSSALSDFILQEDTRNAMIAAINGFEGSVDNSIDYRGKPVFGVTRFIDSMSWGLVAKIDKQEALGSVNSLILLYYFIIGLAIIFIIISSFLIERSILRPIIDLTVTAKKFKAGHLNVRASVKDKDEIGLLATTFNNMASSIEKSYDNLEIEVSKRTKELELAKAKDEAILSSLGDGLVFVDENRIAIYANKSALDMLEFTEKEIVGKIWPEGVFKPKNKKLEDLLISEFPLMRALTKKKVIITSLTDDLMYFSKKNNDLIPVIVTASPVILYGEVIGGVIVFREVSKDLEIDKVKTEFVSLASHQLRTPLTAVKWYVEMLADGDAGKLNTDQTEYVGEIKLGNERMIELVNSLLNVSRIDLGTFTTFFEEANLIDLIKEVIVLSKPIIFEKKIELTESYPPKLPLISVDKQLFKIIVDNLVSNAIKYTPDGGKVKISLYEDKNNITLKVKDSGFGIPKEQQKEIFKKLFRADNIRDKDTTGTGLGLYIVKSILEKTGGTIRFESEENKGTTFYASLPKVGMRNKL